MGHHGPDPVTDPDIGHPVRVATIYREYRMKFRTRDASGILIDVHIRQDGQSAGAVPNPFHPASTACVRRRFIREHHITLRIA
jgi:hypothetical protein